jgi:hypothetical protein
VPGWSSFILNDLMIDQCDWHGVYASGSSTLGRCKNITVSKSQGSGVLAYVGAFIILKGREISIDGNCFEGGGNDYGLIVFGHSSKIKIVSPLSNESISKGNKGGRGRGC